MTDVFYSVSPYGTGDIKTGSPNIEITSGVATLSVAQTGNIGVGCAIEYNSTICYIAVVNSSTNFDVVTATGGTPSNQSSTSVTSIHHVWASLSAAEAAISGASYLNTQDLVTSTYTVYIAEYYDHDDSTPDSTDMEFDSLWSTDSTYKFILYAPDDTQAINDQRAVNAPDSAKQYLTGHLRIQSQVDIDIFDIQQVSNDYGVRQDTSGDGSGTITIKRMYSSSAGVAPCYDSYEGTMNIENSIGTDSYFGIYARGGTVTAKYCAIYGNTIGLYRTSGSLTVENCAIFDNTNDDFNGTITSSYCASDDNDNGGTGDFQIHSTYTDLFENYASDDLRLKNYTSTGALIEQANPNAVTTDKAGNSRDDTNPDVGPFEYSAGGPTTITETLSDAFNFAENLTDQLIASNVIEEAFNFAEVIEYISAEILEEISDAFVFAEFLKSQTILNNDLNDAFNLSEDQTGRILINEQIGDSFVFSEYVDSIAEVLEPLLDAIVMADNIVPTVVFLETIEDAITITDSPDNTIVLVESLVDALVLSEEVTDSRIVLNQILDALSMSDSVQYVSSDSFNRCMKVSVTGKQLGIEVSGKQLTISVSGKQLTITVSKGGQCDE